MITVILEDANDKELGRLSRTGNERYLMQSGPEYKYLSRTNGIDYDTFSCGEMAGLLAELQQVRAMLKNPDDIEHVTSIIELAKRCQKLNGATLTFTPWGDEEDEPQG